MSDDTDDVVIEESTEDGDTGTAEQKLKKLRDALHKAQAEANDNLAGWQRTKADFVNLQKRSRDDFAAMQDAGIATTVETLIPLFDSVEASAHDAVLKQLDSTLQKLGVERYRPLAGDPFDPNLHEPVSTVATDDSSLDNTIHTALQSGYRRGAVLLRPARVTVNHHN